MESMHMYRVVPEFKTNLFVIEVRKYISCIKSNYLSIWESLPQAKYDLLKDVKKVTLKNGITINGFDTIDLAVDGIEFLENYKEPIAKKNTNSTPSLTFSPPLYASEKAISSNHEAIQIYQAAVESSKIAINESFGITSTKAPNGVYIYIADNPVTLESGFGLSATLIQKPIHVTEKKLYELYENNPDLFEKVVDQLFLINDNSSAVHTLKRIATRLTKLKNNTDKCMGGYLGRYEPSDRWVGLM